MRESGRVVASVRPADDTVGGRHRARREGRAGSLRMVQVHDQTLWDLVTAERVAIEDVAAAVDAYLANPATSEHRIGGDYILDLAAAVARYVSTHPLAELTNPHEPSRRMAVRSALLMARPRER